MNYIHFILYNVQNTREKHFLYDIVANGRNGIDVDKSVKIMTNIYTN